ncbi:MAG: D-tyrosyl-tRNA(Tyr) deacylase [Ruminococcus sp.]|nr:D-tyrosyl-tRNA(Tyr) deacylase [Ruminococcus sp.]
MKAVVQRVSQASVTVDNKVVSSIGKGYLVLFGAAEGDTEKECERLAEKIASLRIFRDENEKINLSLNDVGGDVLAVSQFTLLADCHKGNRPSFVKAGAPDKAEALYEQFMRDLSERIEGKVLPGIFGADMKVALINDGPFTIVLECVDGRIL